MTTTLITGANKGLGYETARRLLGEGHDVWIAARDRDRDRGAGAAESLGAQFVALDVTDEASVVAAADVVARAGGLDVLVNNAGIVGPRPQVPETTAEDVRITFETTSSVRSVSSVRLPTCWTPQPRPSWSMCPAALGHSGTPATRTVPPRTSCCLATPLPRPHWAC